MALCVLCVSDMKEYSANSLPDIKILNLSKSIAIPDNKFGSRKGENASYQHFIPIPT